MRYFIKFWYALIKEWRFSTRVDQVGYDDINKAHGMKEFAANAEAAAGHSDTVYVVVDNPDAQPPAPT